MSGALAFPAFYFSQKFSNQPQGLSAPLGAQEWNAESVAWLAHSSWRLSTHVASLFLWVPSQEHRSQPDRFSSFPTELHMDFSNSLDCVGVFLPVSSYFSVRLVPPVNVFLMCLWEEVSSMCSYSAILSHQPSTVIKKKKTINGTSCILDKGEKIIMNWKLVLGN